MIEINRNPSKRDLAWFGLMLGAFLGLLGLIARFRFDAPDAARALWIAAAAAAAVYYAVPPLRRPVFLGFLYATFPIGWVVSHVVVSIVFFLVITPIGVVMRAFGYDPMKRKLDPAAKSYWHEHRPCDVQPSRYFRQY